jgi:hypothetical protein
MFLSRGDAEKYLATTPSPAPRPSKNTSHGEWWIRGGLFIPKAGSTAPPRLFFEIHTEPRAWSLLGELVTKLLGDSLTFRDFTHERAFVETLRIEPSPAPGS